MLKMTDEAGDDARSGGTHRQARNLYRNIKSYEDLPELVRLQTAHFFEHYKDLNLANGSSSRDGLNQGSKAEIVGGVKRYKSAKKKPMF
jgi:inorganic pyrophosphatase